MEKGVILKRNRRKTHFEFYGEYLLKIKYNTNNLVLVDSSGEEICCSFRIAVVHSFTFCQEGQFLRSSAARIAQL